MKPLNQYRGFTLIELIIVVLLLAILAAFVVPRLLDLTKPAETATQNALKNALQSAVSIVSSACKVDKTCDENASFSTVDVQGNSVQTTYGYPTAYPNGIGQAIDVKNIFEIRYLIISPPMVLYAIDEQLSCYVIYRAGYPNSSPLFLTSPNCN